LKAIILAGGRGTRLQEETEFKPKPMVEIGGKPIIWHIMKSFSHHGVNDFIICLGYKGKMIIDYFLEYGQVVTNNTSDVGAKNNMIEVSFKSGSDSWNVKLVDTGL
jgi:glucose-1-phosphate cytidylyltransferase